MTVVLSDRWRVVDEPLQWILQRRERKPGLRASGWSARSYCGTRDGLLRCIREYCGAIDPAALAILVGLPEAHA